MVLRSCTRAVLCDCHLRSILKLDIRSCEVATHAYKKFCKEALATANRERPGGRDRTGPIQIKSFQLLALLSTTEVTDLRGPTIQVRRVPPLVFRGAFRETEMEIGRWHDPTFVCGSVSYLGVF